MSVRGKKKPEIQRGSFPLFEYCEVQTVIDRENP